MAKNIVQRIALQGGDEIKKQFQDIGKAGAEAFKQLSDAQGLQSGLNKLGAGLTAIRDRAAGLGDAFKNVGERFTTFGQNAALTGRTILQVGASVTGAVTAFSGLVIYAAKTSDELQNTAASIGLTTEQFTRLSYAASAAGLSTDEFTRAMQGIARTIDRVDQQNAQFAKRQSDLSRDFALGRINVEQYTQRLQDMQFEQGRTTTVFDRLGVSIARNADGTGNLEATLNRTSDAFKALPESANKTALAFELTGSRTAKTANFLNLGAASIARLGEESKRVAPELSKLGQQAMARLNAATETLGKAAGSASKAFLALFAPGITSVVNAITDAIVRNRDALIQFGGFIADKVKPIIADIIALLEGRDQDVQNDWIIKARDGIIDFANAVQSAFTNIIVPAFQAFMAALQVVADAINAVFGTSLTGGQLGIVLVVTKLIGAFGLLGSAIQAVGSLVGVLIAAFGGLPVALAAIGVVVGALVVQALGGAEGIKNGFAAAWQFITDTADQMGRGVLVIVNAIGTGLKALADGILGWFGTSIDGVKSFFVDLGSTIKGWADAAYAYIKPIVDLIASISAKIGSAFGGGGSSTPGFASGGLVRGPGSGTSDSIVARISNREFIEPERIVSRYGADLFEAFRRGKIAVSAARSLLSGRSFSTGGLVSALSNFGMPRYADGGLVATAGADTGSGRPIYLQIPGAQPIGPMHAGGDVVDQLTRSATAAKIRSGGRKPSWYGG
ncbi:MAG: hypothetical protein AB7K64_12445 [Variibacter sp.]